MLIKSFPISNLTRFSFVSNILQNFKFPTFLPFPINFFFNFKKKGRKVGEEMHLWPSQRVRDSFKKPYLTWMNRNENLMKKKSKASSSSSDQASRTPLLSDHNKSAETEDSGQLPSNSKLTAVVALIQDLVLILSCCFCCGGNLTPLKTWP